MRTFGRAGAVGPLPPRTAPAIPCHMQPDPARETPGRFLTRRGTALGSKLGYFPRGLHFAGECAAGQALVIRQALRIR